MRVPCTHAGRYMFTQNYLHIKTHTRTHSHFTCSWYRDQRVYKAADYAAAQALHTTHLLREGAVQWLRVGMWRRQNRLQRVAEQQVSMCVCVICECVCTCVCCVRVCMVAWACGRNRTGCSEWQSNRFVCVFVCLCAFVCVTTSHSIPHLRSCNPTCARRCVCTRTHILSLTYTHIYTHLHTLTGIPHGRPTRARRSLCCTLETCDRLSAQTHQQSQQQKQQCHSMGLSWHAHLWPDACKQRSFVSQHSMGL